jgi:hypothetical protein
VSEKQRTGRPLKEHAAGTQVTITLQVPAELKLKLQAQAIRSNRTLSQEAQRRLERSFSAQALQEDALAITVEVVAKQFVEGYQRAALAPHAAELTRILAEIMEQHQRAAEPQRAQGQPRPSDHLVVAAKRLRKGYQGK